MDLNTPELLRSVVIAAEGEIVGRIRFQKIVYLLEQAGMESGLQFSYYHYGPYSEEVSSALETATLHPKLICENEGKTLTGHTYSIFSVTHHEEASPSQLGSISWDKACQMIRQMKAHTSTVIELAATIHWLKEKERVANWREELKIRKGDKVTDERVEKALNLLSDLSL